MDPRKFNFVPGLLGRTGVGWLFDEREDMYYHVIDFCVVRLFEVAANLFQLLLYGFEVFLEPVHETSFGLAHVLYFASAAADTVD